MIPIKLPSAAAALITVSTTAISLEAAIRTAASDNNYLIPTDCDAVDLFSETNGFRYFPNGNTPTAALGVPVAAGGIVSLRGVSPQNIKLIRSGGSDATITVQLGRTNPK